MIWLSFVLLLLFLAVGAIDGIYFHLKKYQLFAHKESRTEHLLHSIRALLLVPTILFLYVVASQGWQLYLALGLVIIDLVVMVADVLIEYKSRASLGGLTSAEYTVHMVANSLHMMAITLAFASRPLEYWQLNYNAALGFSIPEIIKTLSTILIITTSFGAIQHLLLLHPKFSKRFSMLHQIDSSLNA
jgi:hypothetical protein